MVYIVAACIWILFSISFGTQIHGHLEGTNTFTPPLWMFSTDRKVALHFQADGNLLLKWRETDTMEAFWLEEWNLIWGTGTAGDATEPALTFDGSTGKFSVHEESNPLFVYWTNTINDNKPPFYLVVSNSRIAYILNSENEVIWSTTSLDSPHPTLAHLPTAEPFSTTHMPTNAPFTSTNAPVIATNAPFTSTNAPVVATNAPIMSTKAPVTTPAPYVVFIDITASNEPTPTTVDKVVPAADNLSVNGWDLFVLVLGLFVICVLFTSLAYVHRDKIFMSRHKVSLERNDSNGFVFGDNRQENAVAVQNNENVQGERGAFLVKKWLEEVGLPQYHDAFVENGYESLMFIKDIDGREQLEELNIVNEMHQVQIMNAINMLNNGKRQIQMTQTAGYTMEKMSISEQSEGNTHHMTGETQMGP